MGDRALAALAVAGVLLYLGGRRRVQAAPSFDPSGFDFSGGMVPAAFVDGGFSAVNDLELDPLFHKHGAATGVDWRLLKAVGLVESNLDPAAVNNNEPGGARSIGVMQLLCPSKKYLPGWNGSREPDGGCAVLFDPDVNIGYGAAILKWNLENYGFPRGVAIYNNWSARHEPSGGPFPNQSYVDRVLGHFRRLGGSEIALVTRYGAGSRGEPGGVLA